METEQPATDREARERALYREYAAMVYNLGLRRTQSKEAAEDVRQQVFMNVFRNLDRFRRDCRLGTWIYQITLNECYHHNRREYREGRKIRAFLDESGPEGGKDEPKEWENRLVAGKILDLADPETLKALEMIHTMGLTHEEVAQAFGLSRVTITKRMERFKVRAAKALEPAGRN